MLKLDDAIKKISEVGTGAMLCKFDIKDAFKIVQYARTSGSYSVYDGITLSFLTKDI